MYGQTTGETANQKNEPIDEFISAAFKDYERVTPRFSLAYEPNSRDIISKKQSDEMSQHLGYQRLLVLRADITNEIQRQQISKLNVPQLPLLKEIDQYLIFGILEGLKPLEHEGLFENKSSTTHIGDEEIFRNVGWAHRAYYKATGSLLIDNIGANPLRHFAVKAFMDDSQSIIYLYPPYNPAPEYNNLNVDDALVILREALSQNLPNEFHLDTRIEVKKLVNAMCQGFLEI